jgi:hypothetical protein
MCTIYEESLRTTQRTQRVIIKKAKLWMVNKKMAAATFNAHTEHTKTQNVYKMRGPAVNNGGTRTHHEVLKNYGEHAVVFKTKSVMICFKTLNR